jgi:hypothetical protein
LRRPQFALKTSLLRIEIRSVDLGEDIARLHMRAEIEVPHFQVAADASIDGRLVPGLNVARQCQLLFWSKYPGQSRTGANVHGGADPQTTADYVLKGRCHAAVLLDSQRRHMAERGSNADQDHHFTQLVRNPDCSSRRVDGLRKLGDPRP